MNFDEFQKKHAKQLNEEWNNVWGFNDEGDVEPMAELPDESPTSVWDLPQATEEEIKRSVTYSEMKEIGFTDEFLDNMIDKAKTAWVEDALSKPTVVSVKFKKKKYCMVLNFSTGAKLEIPLVLLYKVFQEKLVNGAERVDKFEISESGDSVYWKSLDLYIPFKDLVDIATNELKAKETALEGLLGEFEESSNLDVPDEEENESQESFEAAMNVFEKTKENYSNAFQQLAGSEQIKNSDTPEFSLSNVQFPTTLKHLVGSSGLCITDTEAAKRIQEKAVRLDGELHDNPDEVIETSDKWDGVILSVGKKRFVRLIA